MMISFETFSGSGGAMGAYEDDMSFRRFAVCMHYRPIILTGSSCSFFCASLATVSISLCRSNSDSSCFR